MASEFGNIRVTVDFKPAPSKALGRALHESMARERALNRGRYVTKGRFEYTLNAATSEPKWDRNTAPRTP